MRVLFALPGLHRYDRGAEIAFISVANELSKLGEDVTLIGSGSTHADTAYRYLRAPCIGRSKFEKLPSLPVVRHEYAYEELTFVPSLLTRYRPADFDVTVTCSYPFTNWVLRRPVLGGRRPPHVFVTQNGDWPATNTRAEYQFFGCEGMVCTNPDYLGRNEARWNCRLIPNGVDTARFTPGVSNRAAFGLPADRKVVLMVSALIASKRVDAAIEAISRLDDFHLVVAGDGPLRTTLVEQAAERMRGRFTLLSVPAAQMPDLYRSADLFLHMSLEEAFGNVLVEALACGLPVVGHDTPRLRWIVGEDGIPADTTSTDNVVAAVLRAAEAGPSQVGQRIRRASGFAWSGIGLKYRDFLREVASASREGDN